MLGPLLSPQVCRTVVLGQTALKHLKWLVFVHICGNSGNTQTPRRGGRSALEIGILVRSWLMGQALCCLGRSVLTEPSPGLLSEGGGAGPEKGLALLSSMLIKEVS